jgi:hypothetical protein
MEQGSFYAAGGSEYSDDRSFEALKSGPSSKEHFLSPLFRCLNISNALISIVISSFLQ